jgi:hypothetical protein
MFQGDEPILGKKFGPFSRPFSLYVSEAKNTSEEVLSPIATFPATQNQIFPQIPANLNTR